MSDDLIRRLHKVEPDAPGERTRWLRNPDGPEAADRIAALEADNERLRRASRTPFERIAAAVAEARAALAKDGGWDE